MRSLLSQVQLLSLDSGWPKTVSCLPYLRALRAMQPREFRPELHRTTADVAAEQERRQLMVNQAIDKAQAEQRAFLVDAGMR